MTLWWLKFRGGRAVIIEGESLAHARLLVAVNELGRTSHFIGESSLRTKPVTCSSC
jgi:hypothetical protein